MLWRLILSKMNTHLFFAIFKFIFLHPSNKIVTFQFSAWAQIRVNENTKMSKNSCIFTQIKIKILLLIIVISTLHSVSHNAITILYPMFFVPRTNILSLIN